GRRRAGRVVARLERASRRDRRPRRRDRGPDRVAARTAGGAVPGVQRTGQHVLGAAVRPRPPRGWGGAGSGTRDRTHHRGRPRCPVAPGSVERRDHTSGGRVMTIRLVTDSSADLPAGWVREFGITVVGLHV